MIVISRLLRDPASRELPEAHASTHEPGGADPMDVNAAAGVGSLRTLGTSATSAAAGNDARFTDARTPTAHAASHQHGGADQIATTTPGANVIPKANSAGKLDAAWGGTASTLATLDGSSKVIQDPANAQAGAAPNKIPISDGSGKLDTWISDGNTTTKGKLQLATDGEVSSAKAVAANDVRLSNSRTPVLAGMTDNRVLRVDGTTGVQQSHFTFEDEVEGTWAHNETKACFTVPSTASKSYTFECIYSITRTAGGGVNRQGGRFSGLIIVNSGGTATLVTDATNTYWGTLAPGLNRSITGFTYQTQIVTAPGDSGRYAFHTTLRVADVDLTS